MKNKALEASLGDKFAFMKRRRGDRTSPYQHWGCECGDGWYRLINDLCGEITAAYSRAGKETTKRVEIKVEISSREKMTGSGELMLSDNDAVISFYDAGCGPVDIADNGAAILCAELDDIDSDDPDFDEVSFFPQADKVAEFIVSAAAAGKRIICQCEYGMSRSAGCAAAILEYYQHSGITFFADDRYCPNKAVFRKLLAALKKRTGFDTVQR